MLKAKLPISPLEQATVADSKADTRRRFIPKEKAILNRSMAFESGGHGGRPARFGFSVQNTTRPVISRVKSLIQDSEPSRYIPFDPVLGGRQQGQNRDKFFNPSLKANTSFDWWWSEFITACLGATLLGAVAARTTSSPNIVICIGRLSKQKESEEQTNETIDSSLAVVRNKVDELFDVDVEIVELAEQISGLVSDRSTILQAKQMIKSGGVLCVMVEDLSRLYRNPMLQYEFVFFCVDAEVRFVSVADNLDTFEENWETNMSVAALRHSMPVVDAKRRQGRKNIHAFRNGGNVQKIKFGYRKLSREEAKTGKFGPVGLRMTKLAEHTETIKRMRKILMTSVNGCHSYVPVLDWLSKEKIPVGEYVDGNRWTQQLVKGLLSDPILKGVRRFRSVLCQRSRLEGKLTRQKNPNGPDTEVYPELAHLSDEEFDSLQVVINNIAENNRNRSGSESPLYRKARKDALFPRQHATCSICGAPMHAYDRDQLKCRNASGKGHTTCWNHVQVDGDLTRTRFTTWLISHVNDVPGVRSAIVEFALEELSVLRSAFDEGGSDRRSEIIRLRKESKNIAKAIRQGGQFAALLEEASKVEGELHALEQTERQQVLNQNQLLELQTPDEIDEKLDEIVGFLSRTSFGFASLLREVVSVFEIVPVQAIDSGLVRPRVRFTFDVDRLRIDSDTHDPIPPVTGEIDLFIPPKHVKYLQECLDIRRDNPKLSLKKIAGLICERLENQCPEDELPDSISYMTVKRCFRLAKLMEAEGIVEPYRVLTEQPAKASRWKHKS